MRQLSLSVLRDSLVTIYKTFIRPDLDYVPRDQQGQYLCKTRPRFTLSKKMVSEFTFFFYKIVHGFSPVYLTAYIGFASEMSHNTRSSSQRHLEVPICRTKNSQSSFFPCCIKYGMVFILTCKIQIQIKNSRVKYRHLLR